MKMYIRIKQFMVENGQMRLKVLVHQRVGIHKATHGSSNGQFNLLEQNRSYSITMKSGVQC
jgi:hypothetical protein